MADELGRALDSRMDYIIRGNEDLISPPPLDLLLAEEISKELVRSILIRNAPGMESEIRADATEDLCNSVTSPLAHHDQGAPVKTSTVTFSSDPATQEEKQALPIVTPRHSTSTEGALTLIRSDQSLSSIASMVDTTSRNDMANLDSRGEAVVRRPVLSANGSRLFSASSMTYSPSEVTSRATPEPYFLSANSTGHLWSCNSTGNLRQTSGELESLDAAGLASDLANVHLSLMPSSSIAMRSASMSGNGFPVVSEDPFLEDDNASLAAKQITSVSQEVPQSTEGEDQVAEVLVDWFTDDAVFSNELQAETSRGSRTASVRTLASMVTDDALSTELSSPSREELHRKSISYENRTTWTEDLQRWWMSLMESIGVADKADFKLQNPSSDIKIRTYDKNGDDLPFADMTNVSEERFPVTFEIRLPRKSKAPVELHKTTISYEHRTTWKADLKRWGRSSMESLRVADKEEFKSKYPSYKLLTYDKNGDDVQLDDMKNLSEERFPVTFEIRLHSNSKAKMQQATGFSSVLHGIDDDAVDDNTVDMLTSALISDESLLVTDGTSLPPEALSYNRGWTQETKDFDSSDTPIVESGVANSAGMGSYNRGWTQDTKDFESMDAPVRETVMTIFAEEQLSPVATDADLVAHVSCLPTEPEDSYEVRVSLDGSQASFIDVDSDPSSSFPDITVDRFVPHVETYPEYQLSVISQESATAKGHAIPEEILGNSFLEVVTSDKQSGMHPSEQEPLFYVDVDTIPESPQEAASRSNLLGHAFVRQEDVPSEVTSYNDPFWAGRLNESARKTLEEPVRYGCPLEQHLLLEERRGVIEETSALDRTTLQMLDRPSLAYKKGLDTSLQSRANRVLDGATYELLVKSGIDSHLRHNGSWVSDETIVFNQGAIAPAFGECDVQKTVDEGSLQVIEYSPVGQKVDTKDVSVAQMLGQEDVLMDSASATLLTDDGHSWFDDTLQIDVTSSMAKENQHLMGTSTTAAITANSFGIQSMSYSQLSSSEKEVQVQHFGTYCDNSVKDLESHEPRLESLQTRVLPFEHSDDRSPLTRHHAPETRCEEDPIIKDRSYSFSPHVPTEVTKLPEDNLSVDFDLESIDAAGAAGSRVLSRVTSPLPRESAKAKAPESGCERDVFGRLLANMPIQPSPDDVACRCASLLEGTSPWSPHPPSTESTFAFRRRVLSGNNRPDSTVASREEPEQRRSLFVADEEKSASHSLITKCEDNSNVVFSTRGNLFSGPCDMTQASNVPLVPSHNASEFLAEHASLLNELQISLDGIVADERESRISQNEQIVEVKEAKLPFIHQALADSSEIREAHANATQNRSRAAHAPQYQEIGHSFEANSSSCSNDYRTVNDLTPMALREAPLSGNRQMEYSSHEMALCSERAGHQKWEQSTFPQEQRNEVLKEEERKKHFDSLQRLHEQKDCTMSVEAPSLQPVCGNALVAAQQVTQVLSSTHVDYDESDDADVSVATIGDIPNFLDVEADEEAAGLMRAKAKEESTQSLQSRPRQSQPLHSQHPSHCRSFPTPQPIVGQTSVVSSESRDIVLPERVQPGSSRTTSKDNCQLPSDRIDFHNVSTMPLAKEAIMERSRLQPSNPLANDSLQNARPQARAHVSMDRIELLRAEALQSAKLEGTVGSSIDTDAVLEFLKAETSTNFDADSYTQSEWLRHEALQGAHERGLIEVPQVEAFQNIELEGMLPSSTDFDRQSDSIRAEALRSAQLQGELLVGVDSNELVELLRGDAFAQLEGAFNGAIDRHELRDWKKYVPQDANENAENPSLKGSQPVNTGNSIEILTQEPLQCSNESIGDFHSAPLQGPYASAFRSTVRAPPFEKPDFCTASPQGPPIHQADDRLCNQINDRRNDAVVRDSYREDMNAWADLRNPAYTDLRNMCNQESGIPYDCLDHFTQLFAVDDAVSASGGRSEQNSGPFHCADGNNLCAQIGDAKPVLLSETIISESMITAAQSIYRCETQEQAFQSLVKLTIEASLPEWLGSQYH